jgi:hypothetical protein
MAKVNRLTRKKNPYYEIGFIAHEYDVFDYYQKYYFVYNRGSNRFSYDHDISYTENEQKYIDNMNDNLDKFFSDGKPNYLLHKLIKNLRCKDPDCGGYSEYSELLFYYCVSNGFYDTAYYIYNNVPLEYVYDSDPEKPLLHRLHLIIEKVYKNTVVTKELVNFFLEYVSYIMDNLHKIKKDYCFRMTYDSIYKTLAIIFNNTEFKEHALNYISNDIYYDNFFNHYREYYTNKTFGTKIKIDIEILIFKNHDKISTIEKIKNIFKISKRKCSYYKFNINSIPYHDIILCAIIELFKEKVYHLPGYLSEHRDVYLEGIYKYIMLSDNINIINNVINNIYLSCFDSDEEIILYEINHKNIGEDTEFIDSNDSSDIDSEDESDGANRKKYYKSDTKETYISIRKTRNRCFFRTTRRTNSALHRIFTVSEPKKEAKSILEKTSSETYLFSRGKEYEEHTEKYYKKCICKYEKEIKFLKWKKRRVLVKKRKFMRTK